MTRNLAILLVGLALVLLLVLLASLSAPRVRSSTPQAWRPVPAALFTPFPESAKGGATTEYYPAPVTPSASPRLATVAPRPTSEPTPKSGLIPPFVAEKGLAGIATWWNSWGRGMYAAAGPRLRDVLGPDYVGQWVTACAGERCVRVKLTTSCACQPDSRIIDLSLDAFSRLADPSVGIVEVVISW